MFIKVKRFEVYDATCGGDGTIKTYMLSLLKSPSLYIKSLWYTILLYFIVFSFVSISSLLVVSCSKLWTNFYLEYGGTATAKGFLLEFLKFYIITIVIVYLAGVVSYKFKLGLSFRLLGNTYFKSEL